MNWLKLCEIGIKVVTAAVAGFAIFVGIDRAVNRGKNGTSPNMNNSSNPGANGGAGSKFDPNVQDPNNPNRHDPPAGSFPQCNERTNGSQSFIDGLKGATSMCSKLLSFAQSLTSVAENFSRIFNTGPDCGYYNYNYNYNYNNNGGFGYNNGGYRNDGGWNYTPDGLPWRRINPFIVEFGSKENPGNQQRYPF